MSCIQRKRCRHELKYLIIDQSDLTGQYNSSISTLSSSFETISSESIEGSQGSSTTLVTPYSNSSDSSVSRCRRDFIDVIVYNRDLGYRHQRKKYLEYDNSSASSSLSASTISNESREGSQGSSTVVSSFSYFSESSVRSCRRELIDRNVYNPSLVRRRQRKKYAKYDNSYISSSSSVSEGCHDSSTSVTSYSYYEDSSVSSCRRELKDPLASNPDLTHGRYRKMYSKYDDAFKSSSSSVSIISNESRQGSEDSSTSVTSYSSYTDSSLSTCKRELIDLVIKYPTLTSRRHCNECSNDCISSISSSSSASSASSISNESTEDSHDSYNFEPSYSSYSDSSYSNSNKGERVDDDNEMKIILINLEKLNL